MMTATAEFDSAALFTMPKPIHGAAEERGYQIYGRPELFGAIRELGVDVHVVRGKEHIEPEGGTAWGVVRPEYRTEDPNPLLQRLGDQAIAGYDVMRVHSLLFPDTPLDRHTAVLNPTNLMTYLRRKHAANVAILEPLGIYRKSLFVSEGTAIDQLERLDGPLVAKPNRGFKSRGLLLGDWEEVTRQLFGVAEDYVIEERLVFARPMPGVRGIDEDQQARLQHAYEHQANTEIRMYSFGSPDDWHPVARVSEPGSLEKNGKEWVIIDPDSVPGEVYDMVTAAKRLLDEKTATDDTLLALDAVYARAPSDEDYKWQIMEMNAEPYIVRPNVDRATGLTFRRLFAEQVVRIARKNHTEKVR